MPKGGKMIQWINYRVRVIIQDDRVLIGTFLAFDRHMNIVLADCDEFRRIKSKKQGEPEKEIKRSLGMILLRGENIISLTAEAPPASNTRKAGEANEKTGSKKQVTVVSAPAPQQAPWS